MIYLASGGGHLDENDGIEYLALTEGMIMHQSIKLPVDASVYEKTNFDIKSLISYIRSVHGESPIPPDQPLQPHYVGYGLLLSVIAIPFYLVAMILRSDPVHFVPYFLNSTILALTTLILFLTSKEIFSSNKISFVLSIVFAVTSFVWPYISSMWQQPLVSLILISSIYFLLLSKRTKKILYVVLSGTFLGLVIHAHPGYIFLVPIFFIYSMYQYKNYKKYLLIFPISFAPFIILQGYLNYSRFGSILNFGYADVGGLSFHNDTQGIAGLILSPGYGIAFFFPLFVLFPLSIFLLYKNYSKSTSILIIYTFVSTWIFFGTQTFPYWADGIWGPRHLVAVMPFVVLPLGAFLKKYTSTISKTLFSTLATIGFSVNILGVLVWFMYGLAYGWEVEGLAGVKNAYALFAWNPYFSPIVQNAKVLSSNYLLSVPGIHVNSYQIIGLAPCRYDNYLYCNFGLVPVLSIGIVIFIVFLLIKQKVFKNNLIKEI